MHGLIASVYSIAEAERSRTYQLSEDDRELIKQAGVYVLEKFPCIPNCCTAMSATWAALIRDSTHIPAHVVAGNLLMGEKRLFWNDCAFESLPKQFDVSNSAWDGHCWVDFAGTIGEVSLFRTAYAPSSPGWLRAEITRVFGKGRGLLLAPPEAMSDDGLHYEARYVLSDVQITGIVRGAWQIMHNGESKSD